MQIKSRNFNQTIVDTLISAGENPLLARLYAARGVELPSELETTLAHIIPPEQLTNNTQMAFLLGDAMLANKKILVITMVSKTRVVIKFCRCYVLFIVLDLQLFVIIIYGKCLDA